MLSSHLFFCLPCLLSPFIMPCKMVLITPDEYYRQPIAFKAVALLYQVLSTMYAFGISLLVECRTCDCKVASLNPSRSNREIFSSGAVPTFIWCPYHPHVSAVACKRPQSFCQKCRWQVTPKHAYALDPRSQSGLTMLLSRHGVGTYPETSSHANCSGITEPVV